MLRTAIAVLSLAVASACAWGAEMTVREGPLPGSGGGARVRCYSAPGEDPRPVVVLVHGAGGFTPFARHYESYAEALVPRGFRVCAVLYYSAEDTRVVAGKGRSDRRTLFERRFTQWVRTIHGAADSLRELPTTRRDAIGMLGFSQGAYLAVAVAGTHPGVKALAEFYGGFPFPMEARITQLPPTLIVHGESDTVIPVAEARAMEAIARARATSYTMKLYPGAGHGFDMRPDDPQAIDARRQAVDFFVDQLKPVAK
jgi:carboxymethylenebutenolidase